MGGVTVASPTICLTGCMINDKAMQDTPSLNQCSLPKFARLPINRCNLPASILGSLTFQHHPARLRIDGVAEIYKDIFERLEKLHNAVVRAKHFMHYMSVQFMLEQPEEMGFMETSRRDRSKATYLRLIRGWFFNPDSVEGAILKGWVESRFGLMPRFHNQPIRSPRDECYTRYIQEWAQGLYNTNALETQLDLLYTYCQLELEKKYGNQAHITLYRGFNKLSDYETFAKTREGCQTVLLNNVNSFSASRERADEFGDYVMQVNIPLSKIIFYKALLPGMLAGEDEYVVIGGLYHVKLL